jgi:hypothetical protein
MKLLYVSGTYYPAAGGAEISMHTFLKEAKKRGHDILVLTDLKRQDANGSSLDFEGITVHGIEHAEREEKIRETIHSFKPDKVLTQLLWSDVTLKIANEMGVESILRFCKVPSYLDITAQSQHAPSKILVVSEFVKEYVHEQWQRDSYVIPPPIDLKHIHVSSNTKKYITMFNPNPKKGGSVFKEIVKALPEYEFAIVKGWISLRMEMQQILKFLNISVNR